MTPKEELAQLITERLYNPGAFVERKNIDSQINREPLNSWQMRAVMELFVAADVRNNKGQEVIVTYCLRRKP